MLSKGRSEDLALFLVDLTFHGQWHLFQVQRQLPCSEGFACLGSKRSSLANCTGATVEVMVATWKNGSSKLCFLFDSLESRSLQQMWSSCQLPRSRVVSKKRSCRAEKLSCKFVGRHQFSRDNTALCYVWEALLF